MDISGPLLELLYREAHVNRLTTYLKPPAPLPGGNETTILTFALALPPEHPWAGPKVVRIFHDVRHPLQHRIETAAHNLLSNLGYPVPHVFHVSDDPTIGGPWIVMEHIGGSMLGSDAFQMPSGMLRFPAIFKHLPTVLASLHLRLHEIDAAALRATLAATTDDAEYFTPRGQIAATRGWLPTDRGELAEALSCMEARLPATVDPVICHGDFHPLNVMMENGVVSGVLDWSKICFADRAYDVGGTLALLELTSLTLPPGVRHVAEWLKVRMSSAYLRQYQTANMVLDKQHVAYFYTLRALLELVYASTHDIPETGELSAWDRSKLGAVVRRYTGVAV